MTIDTLINNKVDGFTEELGKYFDENEDLFASMIADFLRKIDDAKIDCKEYEVEKAVQDHLDSQVKWWQFKKKKEIEKRKEIERIKSELNPHPCDKRKKEEVLSEEEKERLEKLLNARWNHFEKSWKEYYNKWQSDKKLLFNKKQRISILKIEIESLRLQALYELKAPEVAKKLRLLDLAKPVFPLNNLEKLRSFLANNEKGMKIDPDVEIDYLNTPLDKIAILDEIFKRYFYSGNTKKEKEELRVFITDAIFMLYEQQTIQSRLDQ